MQGLKRKVLYVFSFEAIGITFCSITFSIVSSKNLAYVGLLAIASSIIAVVWNTIFTTIFELWEARQPVRGRSVKRRVVHTLIFQVGLVVMLVPLMAWWLEMSLRDTLIMQIGIILFFLVYTFAFNCVFDYIFGLPASAQGRSVSQINEVKADGR